MDNTGDNMIQRLENLIERIEDENSWDFGFASSLRDQTKEGRTLSPRQTEILEKIEANHSDEVLAANKDWAESWDAEKAERLQIVAAYYYRNGYFQKSNVPSSSEIAHLSTETISKKLFVIIFVRKRSTLCWSGSIAYTKPSEPTRSSINKVV